MIEAIKLIYEFNKKADLLSDGYNDAKEAQYVIEEALEGFDINHLNKKLDIDENSHPKYTSRAIVTGMCVVPDTMTDVERFDKHLDILVFTFGALFKMKLSIPQIFRGLTTVMKRNIQKLSVGKDAEGKQMKPANFVGPEKELQLILNERIIN